MPPQVEIDFLSTRLIQIITLFYCFFIYLDSFKNCAMIDLTQFEQNWTIGIVLVVVTLLHTAIPEQYFKYLDTHYRSDYTLVSEENAETGEVLSIFDGDVFNLTEILNLVKRLPFICEVDHRDLPI